MDVLKKMKQQDMALAVLFIIYLIFNIQAPPQICSTLDSTVGNIVIALVALYLFSVSNPVVGVLALLVAVQFISRCQFTNSPMKKLAKMVDGKSKFSSPWKESPITLEEEMVKKMAPLVVNTEGPQFDYRPVMDDQHGASFVHSA